jgi:hypothetical protein
MATDVTEGHRPKQPLVIKSVRIVDAPAGELP